MKQYIAGLLGLIMLTACGGGKKEAEKETAKAGSTEDVTSVSFTPQQLKSVGIETGKPLMEKISGLLRVQGKIDVPPQSTVSLSFPLGGYLKSTTLLPGMPVKKGQVLAEMEDMQFIQLQQDYLTAKELYELAVLEHSRQKDLNASKASSDKVLQQAKAEMEKQRILMNALGMKLEMIGIDAHKLDAGSLTRTVHIKSPINGFVSKVNVNVGKYTAPTDMLFELVDPGDIHLSLNVFEKDLNSLSVGQKVTAYTNANPDKKYMAEIILISKSLNADRAAEIHCHFENYHATLVPGMFMNGEIAVDNKEALTVPEEAVVRWENKFYVFVDAGNNNFRMTEIVPGISSKGRQQIEANGITAQTSLVTKNAYAVLMKIKNTGEEE
ncbi:efflux RND transporter periplasmic adaptor subunit [Filimonas effusa]|uniref:Efflux RND transporter periplasmic adaptor subunit n=1 Tax=Filimonas effusa TaxID=2508721 RepID=A0A4Q1DBL0_9BACT|nr:efflux RND transporter periplasmic adaptor subunit [Filimonas effusa]RXK86827.1 efflux RND transporter periplasmic adaptor subunit [Filimonas effusa]